MLFRSLAFQQAVDKLQYLVDNYYRKNTGDFAQVLIGLLYYRARQYDIATEKLGKIAPTSVYYNAAETLLNDMKEIKAKKTAPNYGSDIADTYKVWDPNAVIGVNIIPSRPPSGAITGGGAEEIAVTRADDGSIVIQAAPGSKIQFALQGLADEDKFNEYMNDKEDLSRLPKEMREEKEKDLLALHWSAEDGNFSDENEGAVKVWQAPLQPGSYKVTAKTDDFGLVRTPDRGNRKDDAKDLTVTVVVGE